MKLGVPIQNILFGLNIWAHICANSVDPDQTAPKEQSNQGLHCLYHSNIKLFTHHHKMKITFQNFKTIIAINHGVLRFTRT